MSVLVSGSLAIDFIMVFPDRFRNHILADRLHVLNVAFHVPTLRKSFGGTAGNIAYHLRLLGEEPVDATGKRHILWPVIAAQASALDRTKPWKAGFPVSQAMLRYVEFEGEFADRTESGRCLVRAGQCCLAFVDYTIAQHLAGAES